MDTLIITVAKLLGLTVYITVFLAVTYMGASYAYRIFRNVRGALLVDAALYEYQRTHPQEFEKFQKTKVRFFEE